MVEVAPKGWIRLDLQFRATAQVCDYNLSGIWPNGEIVQISEPLYAADKAMRELRRLMYEPGRGTWFMARYNIDSEMNFSDAYDYDNDPIWRLPTSRENWWTDLRVYPRNADHIPAWLQEKLTHVDTSDMDA